MSRCYFRILKHVPHEILKISSGWTATVLSNAFFTRLIHTVPKNPLDCCPFSWHARFKHREVLLVEFFHFTQISSQTKLFRTGSDAKFLFILCQAGCAYHSFARLTRNSLEIVDNFKNPWKRKHFSFVFRAWYHLQFLTRFRRSNVMFKLLGLLC